MAMTKAPASSRYLIVGSAARMRRSLLISPVALLSGTLKSTRMRTRLPLRSAGFRSRSVFLAISNRHCQKMETPAESKPRAENQGDRSSLRDHVPQQIDAPVRVAPFVVVPADQLEERLAYFRILHRGVAIEDTRRGIVDEVGGYHFIFRVVQDALQIGLARLLHGGADFLECCFLLRPHVEIDYRYRCGRVAKGHAGELAFDLGANEPHGFGSARARRDDIDRRRSAPLPVLLGGPVVGLLRRRVAVYRRHQAFFDAEPLFEK